MERDILNDLQFDAFTRLGKAQRGTPPPATGHGNEVVKIDRDVQNKRSFPRVLDNAETARRRIDAINSVTQPKEVIIDGIHLKIAGNGRDRRDIERTGSYSDLEALQFVKSKFQAKNLVAVDVGAGFGNHSIYLAAVAGANRVIAFESDKILADALEENININNLGDKVAVSRVDLGGRRGLPSFSPHEGDEVTEKPQTLDAQDLQVPNVDLIRIGRNSFNPNTLAGAKETVKKYNPAVLWLEVPHRGGIFTKIVDGIDELGYEETQKLGQVTIFEKKSAV